MKTNRIPYYLIFVLITYFLASPYFVINRFRLAVKDANYNRIEKMIDLYSIRENMKQSVSELFNESESFKLINQSFINSFTNVLIDKAITTDHIRALFLIGKIKGELKYKHSDRDSVIIDDNKASKQSSISLYYIGFNNFILKVKNKETGNSVTGVWNRVGLNNWILSKISID